MAGYWYFVLVACFAGLAALLTLWGGSLLYRALDGDRFTKTTRIKGRWVNRVSKPLFALACCSIVLGGLLTCLTLAVATEVSSLRRLVFLAGTAAVFTLAVVITAWSWAGRRASGKPRCPKCLYDVSAVATDTCPECGFVADTDQMWLKPRIRKRGLIVGGSLVIIAVAMGAIPVTIGYGWRKLIPTNVMIAGVGILPDSVISGNSDNYYRGAPTGSLADRIYASSLSQAQFERLVSKLELKIASVSNAEELTSVLTLASAIPIGLRPQFTSETAQRFIEDVLLGPDPDSRESYLPDAMIDWSLLGSWQGTEAQAASDRLITLATDSPNISVNAVRWLAAVELADDRLSVLLDLLESAGDGASNWKQYEAAEVIRVIWQMAEFDLTIQAWELWLATADEQRRQSILRVLAIGRYRDQNEIPEELLNRVWPVLLNRIAAELPPPDEAYIINTVPAIIERSHMQALLRQEHITALELAIRTDSLTDRDIALLAWSQFDQVQPINPTLMPVLMSHEDPRVQMATVLTIVTNRDSYFLTMVRLGLDPKELDSLIEPIVSDPIIGPYFEP